MDIDKIKGQLEESIAEIDELKILKFNHPRYSAWRSSVYRKLERAWGKDSSYYQQYDDIFSGPYAVLVGTPDSYFQEEYEKKLEEAREILKSFLLDLSHLSEECKDEPVEVDSFNRLHNIFFKFDHVSKQLLKRYGGRETLEIKDEYDVQDLLHSLLKIHFDDIRKEEWTPAYAGASSRIDFLLKDEQIAIETKMTNDKNLEKEIGEDLIIDIERFQKHDDCQHLICFVYDPNFFLENPRELESDISGKHGRIIVEVIVYPK